MKLHPFCRGAITFALALSFFTSLTLTAQVPADTGKAAGPSLLERRSPIPTFPFPEKAMTTALNDADEAKLKMPVTDASGRIHYIVRLRDNATDNISKQVDNVASNRLGRWHKPAMINLNASMERSYGYTATSITSWLLNTFSAYLTATQVASLRNDNRVEIIEEDHYVQPSALWSDQRYNGPNSPLIPWGTIALGGPGFSNGTTNVWVIDGGVGYHAYLLNVWGKANIDSVSTPAVACYSHATMVAGVIGAASTGGDASGIFGFNYNVPMASIGVLEGVNATLNCATGTPYKIENIQHALDYVRSLPATKVPVINISINGPALSSSSLFKEAMLRATQPGPGFPGAFIVQSAGNVADNACLYGYVPPPGSAQPSDGIMVVGGINENGQPSVPLNGLGAYRNDTSEYFFNWEPGSNYGNCVDIWAPSNNVTSTGGGTKFNLSDQSGSASYSATFSASGTSFAAPYIAGLASLFIEYWDLPTPGAVENAIRMYSGSLPGSFTRPRQGPTQPPAQPVVIPNLSQLFPPAQPTVEWKVIAHGTLGVNSTTNSVNSDSPFTLSYDSIGADYCILTVTLDGSLWYPPVQIAGSGYNWGGQDVKLTNNTASDQLYSWTVDCYSSNQLHMQATTSVLVLYPRGAPTANFYIDGQAIQNGFTYLTNSATTKTFWYTATNVTSCHVRVDRLEADGVRNNWYDTSPYPRAWDMPSYYWWGPTRWDARVNAAGQLDDQTYWYMLVCHLANGGDILTSFQLQVTPAA